jgi:hypothetical protein
MRNGVEQRRITAILTGKSISRIINLRLSDGGRKPTRNVGNGTGPRGLRQGARNITKSPSNVAQGNDFIAKK